GSHSIAPFRLFASGLLFGMAFLMKQHGGCFTLFGLAYVIWDEWRSGHQRTGKGESGSAFARALGRIALFGAGALIPFVITCLILAWAGVFDRFWFWTFTYAREYVAERSVAQGWEDLQAQIGGVIGPDFPLWLLAGVGMIAIGWDPRARRDRV